MSKHHQQKVNHNNTGGTSMSVGSENQNIMPQQFDSTAETGFEPPYEEIQKRAYQIQEEKGGNDLENWLEAERILQEERQGKNRKANSNNRQSRR